MDKIILDFENCTVEIYTDNQQSKESCPELPERKNAILAAMGFGFIDLSVETKQIQEWLDGGPEPDFFGDK